MPSPSPATVVVVSFNTKEKLRRCLSAIDEAHEVIVVDNGSRDGSATMVESEFPGARLIRNERNLGFGAANNLGSSLATRPLTLFLNSDCYAQPGAIERLALELSSPDVVAAGGRLLNPDGSLQLSSANALTLWAVFCEQTYLEKLVPKSPICSPYWNSWRFESAADVEQVMGACLMMRTRQASFDERFFLYVEDTELCRRLRESGKIRYVPDAQFEHDLGASSQSRWTAIARYNHGKELYFAIHRGPLAAAVCWTLNRLGAGLRLVAWLIPCLLTLATVGRFRRQVATFARVFAAPISGPARP